MTQPIGDRLGERGPRDEVRITRGPHLPVGPGARAGTDAADAAVFQRAVELIGRRWSGAVIRALLEGPARFNALMAAVPLISDRMLSERLRELERGGVVERLVDPGPPLRVTYRLTARGQGLAPVVAAIDAWAAGEGE